MVAALQRGGLSPIKVPQSGIAPKDLSPNSQIGGGGKIHPSVNSFRQIQQLFNVGPNPLDSIRGKSSMSISELLTVQRTLSEYAVKVELCAKTAEAASGVVRRLQQGG